MGPYRIPRVLDSKKGVLQGSGADNQGFQGRHHQKKAFLGKNGQKKPFFGLKTVFLGPES